MKIPPCKLFPRHQWAWAKNIWEHHIGPRSVSMKKRGVYRCDCGEVKIGLPAYVSDEEAASAQAGSA